MQKEAVLPICDMNPSKEFQRNFKEQSNSFNEQFEFPFPFPFVPWGPCEEMQTKANLLYSTPLLLLYSTLKSVCKINERTGHCSRDNNHSCITHINRAGKSCTQYSRRVWTFFIVEDILVQKSPKYVAILDLCGDFD